MALNYEELRRQYPDDGDFARYIEDPIRAICEIVRRCRRKATYYEFSGGRSESKEEYEDQILFLHMIERVLEDCRPETRIIIDNAYLQSRDRHWYLEYYTESTYYRLKRSALIDFWKNLDI